MSAPPTPDFHPNPLPFDHVVPRYCHVCGNRLKTTYVADEKRKRLACSRCGTVAYLNPRVVAGAVPEKDGKILLLVRGIPPRKGYWTFPGGFVELGESVKVAAERETREEIRVKVDADELLGVYSYPFSGTAVVVYAAKVLSGKARRTPEALDVRWFAPDQIPWKNLAFDSTRDALTEWARRRAGGKRSPRADRGSRAKRSRS